MPEADEHVIDEIIENMASKLFFHGHPINRKEAKDELKLKVNSDLPAKVETDMWRLYQSYEDEMLHLQEFNPAGDLAQQQPAQQQPLVPPTVKEYELIHACVESARMSCVYRSNKRFTRLELQGPQGLQEVIREQTLAQGWHRSQA